VYKLTKQLQLLQLDRMDDATAGQIVQQAGYGSTIGYVQNLFLHWQA
jgi:hypothetical protein